jgi:iron complex transport system substrate-binding protein
MTVGQKTDVAGRAGLTRRGFVIGSVAAILAGCAEADDPDAAATEPAAPAGTPAPSPSGSASPAGPWSYTDDLGSVATLPTRPQRIAAYIGAAAVLWDFGIRSAGVLGPQRAEDGTAVPAAGRVDLGAVTNLGEEEVDLEQLAALRPDIIVLQKGPAGLDAYPLTENQLDEAREIAPFVAVQSYGASADTVVVAYERLAAALGADVGAAALLAEKQRLSDVQAKLKQVLAGKPGLLAMYTFADTDGFYVAKTKDFPDLLAYAGLGLGIVEAAGPDSYFQKLSWEEADRYPADVIFHDERPTSLQPAVLDEKYPTWRELPAVKAGQVGRWNAETVYSPRGLADAITAMTATLSSARADVVPAGPAG